LFFFANLPEQLKLPQKMQESGIIEKYFYSVYSTYFLYKTNARK